MTADALEYLRNENPVPHGSTAPPLADILARIDSTGIAQPGRRRRFAPALIPALAVAATLAVVAAVVVLAVTHRNQAPAHLPPAHRTTPSVPSPRSLMPRGGMHGALFIQGATSPSADQALVNFSQCEPCHIGHSAAGSPERLWMASTLDGGRSWHAVRTSLDLTVFGFDGPNGWAEGVGADRAIRFFASHDGGRTWHVASSDDPAPGYGNVSLAGGEVWSLGNGCVGTRCVDAILRAPASSDRLTRTATQPPIGQSTNVTIVATAGDAAYVLDNVYGTRHGVSMITHTQLFVTHDGGHVWHRLATPCPRLNFGRLSGSAGALWASCQGDERPTELRRSTDGGHHWTTLPAQLGDLTQLQPASGQVAWALARGGRVMRTADGGRTWLQVWYGGRLAPMVLTGPTPVLTAQSATTATVIAVVTRGHVDGHAAQTDFVTYRTTDGGRTWRTRAVRLPSG